MNLEYYYCSKYYTLVHNLLFELQTMIIVWLVEDFTFLRDWTQDFHLTDDKPGEIIVKQNIRD